jgi:phage gp46-like protein
MATDIAVLWDGGKQSGDISYESGDLVREDGLTSAVILSLFCDSRAGDDSGITDPDARRGWWGDGLTETESVSGLGSNLWLLSREKVTTQTINLCEQYILDALQWMIDDGVVQRLEVDVDVERGGTAITPILAASIRLYFADGDSQVIAFADLWTAQFAETYYLNRG